VKKLSHRKTLLVPLEKTTNKIKQNKIKQNKINQNNDDREEKIVPVGQNGQNNPGPVGAVSSSLDFIKSESENGY
jgi:hypothetical protein